jgi:hypothetical protein
MKRLLVFLLLTPALAFGQSLRSSSDSRTFTTAPTFPGAVSSGTIQTKGLVSTALTTPTNATFTATSGTLNDGTYDYRVTALDAAGETLASPETSLAVSAGAGANGVVVNWGTVVGATSYKVYGRSTGAELYMATVTAPNTTWTDTGAVTPSGALPVLGSSGNISTVSTVTARDLTTTAASGATALSMVNGARAYIGDTYFSGASTQITASGKFSATNGFTGNALSSSTAVPMVLTGADVADGSGIAFQLRSTNTMGAGDVLFKVTNNTTDVLTVGPAGTFSMDGTDSSGTPGAATINQPIGQVSVAASASSVVVTNSLVTTASVIIPVLQFADATCTQILSCVPGAGAFTITMDAACTANTKVGFVLHNYF